MMGLYLRVSSGFPTLHRKTDEGVGRKPIINVIIFNSDANKHNLGVLREEMTKLATKIVELEEELKLLNTQVQYLSNRTYVFPHPPLVYRGKNVLGVKSVFVPPV